MTAVRTFSAATAFAVIFCAAAPQGMAQRLSSASLPSFARNPAAFAGGAAPWAGAASGWSPIVTGFDSGGFAAFGASGTWTGYTYKFPDDTFASFRATSGYAQDLFQRNGVSGFNFSGTEFRFGYDAGRFRPFVGASAIVASPATGNPFVTPNTIGAAVFGQQGARGFTSVSAGFDFKVSDKITFGASVSAGASTDRGISPLTPGVR